MFGILSTAYLVTGIILLMKVRPYRNLMLERMKVMNESAGNSSYVAIGLGIIMVIFWVISIPWLKRQAKHEAFNELMKALDEQDKNPHDTDTGYIEDKRHFRHDPVEDTPEFIAVIENVRAEADRRLELHPFRNGMGYCHPRNKTIKLILREEHGIGWRTPAKMNPHVLYD